MRIYLYKSNENLHGYLFLCFRSFGVAVKNNCESTHEISESEDDPAVFAFEMQVAFTGAFPFDVPVAVDLVDELRRCQTSPTARSSEYCGAYGCKPT